MYGAENCTAILNSLLMCSVREAYDLPYYLCTLKKDESGYTLELNGLQLLQQRGVEATQVEENCLVHPVGTVLCGDSFEQ